MKPIKIKAIAKKEFIHIYRDFRSLYMAIIVPVILVIIFGYALKMDIRDIPMVVWDQQKSIDSRDLIDNFTSSKYFKVLYNAENYSELQEQIDNGMCSVGLVIPANFSQQLKGTKAIPIQILLDGSDPNKANMTIGYVQGVTQKFSANITLSQLYSLGMKSSVMPINNKMRIWFNEELESTNYIIPGLISLVLIIVGAMLTSLVIAREWERGTMETLLSVPITPIEIIIGKIIPYFIIGLFDVFVILVLAKILFNIEVQGSYFLLFVSSSLYLYVAMSFGILVSTVTKSLLISNQIAIIATFLPSFMLSGFVFPINNLPVVLQYITFIVPGRYFIRILMALFLKNEGIGYLWNDFLILFIFSLFLTVLCVKKSQSRIK